MSNTNKPKLSALTSGMLGAYVRPQQLPTIQAGWAEFELLCRARKWPETVIEIARQAFFAGAARTHDIITSMPMDANIVGRVHAAFEAELKDHQAEMLEMRRIREEGNKG
jgi:hypothetical protein